MLKKIFILFIISLSFNVSFAQIMHSFGVTISTLSGKEETMYSSSSFSMTMSTLTYFPRYNILGNTNTSLSIGAPVSIGIGISKDTYGDDVGIAFAYDLPVAVDFNFGCHATKESDKTFGGYIGAGYGYYKVSNSKSQYSDFSGASYGPMARGGVRFGSSKESWGGHSITIGAFYKKGMEKAKFNTFGLTVLYDL